MPEIARRRTQGCWFKHCLMAALLFSKERVLTHCDLFFYRNAHFVITREPPWDVIYSLVPRITTYTVPRRTAQFYKLMRIMELTSNQIALKLHGGEVGMGKEWLGCDIFLRLNLCKWVSHENRIMGHHEELSFSFLHMMGKRSIQRFYDFPKLLCTLFFLGELYS